MKNNNFKKHYIAVLNGSLEKSNGIISVPIARKEGSIIERCADPNGDIAISHYTLLQELKDASIVLYTLETGRTHQLRVHSKYIGHPIIGDTLYGNASSLIQRQALHAYEIEFIHPITKKILRFKADIPNDMNALIKQKR